MSTSAERMRRLRERRAAALLPIDGQAPRNAADLLAPAVEATLQALELGPADAAAAQLARRYARAIDQARDPAWAARWLAPPLLDALVQLGATPAARAKLKPEPARRRRRSWRGCGRPGDRDRRSRVLSEPPDRRRFGGGFL